MSHRVLWGAIVLLGAACLVEGVYIVNRRAVASAAPAPASASANDVAHRLDLLENRLRSEMAGADRFDAQVFDRLFDDEFFRSGFDPFREIGRVEKRLALGLDTDRRPAFETSFQDWLRQRIDLTAMTPKVTDEGKDVLVSFRIPGLDAGSVKVDVNANRIRMTYGAQADSTKAGATVRMAESYEKIVPLPENADPNGFEVRKGKNELTLVLRKSHPAA